MIFPIFESDKVVRVGDKIRLDFRKTFKTPGESAISSFKIKPSASDSFYVVATGSFGDAPEYYFLDWVYAFSGAVTVEVQIEYGTGPLILNESFTLDVITEAQDNLFSSDSDLITHQHDILKFVPDGRSSWNFIHRRSKELILSYFDEEGLVNDDGSKITEDQVTDVSEVRDLSIFKTLRLIFESISNSPDDYFMKKSAHWGKWERLAQLRCVTRLDFDKDGSSDSEPRDNYTIKAGRR